MEQNKVRTYTLYAIGEILLVVIGILIALQINNWNQERLNRIYETTMLKEVNDALVVDLENISTYINYMKRVQYSVREIARMKNDPNIARDSLYQHLDLIDGYGASFLVNRSPFEAIESGGLDKISNPEIRNALSNLYGFSLLNMEGWINGVLRHELFKRNELNEQISGFNIVPDEDVGIVSELVLDNPEKFLSHPKLDVYLYTAGWPLPITIRLMESSEIQMKELISLIDLEINS